MHRPVLQEWTACLGHASIAATVGAAEKGFSAWKALAEEALAKGRTAARSSTGVGGKPGEGVDDADGGAGSCEAAARDLAECCEVRGSGLVWKGTKGTGQSTWHVKVAAVVSAVSGASTPMDAVSTGASTARMSVEIILLV